MKEYTIVHILFTRQVPVKMSELITKVGLSERTIRDVLRSLARMGEAHGFRIRMIRNQGYLLEIKNSERFKVYLEKGLVQRDRVDQGNKQSRQQYLLFNLLQSDTFQSMDRMAEEIGVSRSTIIADLKEVEQQLAAFRLSLTRRAHYGMKIEGDEKDFRKAFSYFILQTSHALQHTEDFHAYEREFDKEKLKVYLLQVLKEKELRISDVFLDNIVTHLSILLYRISKHNFIVSGPEPQSATEPVYLDIARSLASWIEYNYGIKLPADEIEYLALHISGKTIMEHMSAETKAYLRDGISAILDRLDREFLTSFNEDNELREALLLHMFPLLNRLYYNLQLGNPLVEDVYSQYANVFVISFRFAEIIEERYGFKMSRDEAGYVALHFATHLERMQQRNLERFKRIAVICSTGAGSAHLIRLKLEAVFPKASVITAPIAELGDLSSKPVDLILTTVPLDTEIREKPVIHIKQLLDDHEIQRIKEILSLQMNRTQPSHKLMDFKDLFRKELFHLSGPEDYKELLEQRCQEIVGLNFAAKDFPEQVLFRENKFTTIYKNGVAGPHPMRMSAIRDCINVTLLKKPVIYEGKSVQLIFLINLRPGQLFLHKEISKLLLVLMEKEDSRNRLLAVNSYEQFMNEIENLL
ncbi:lichenan operon transcriptional antiterminator [Paenibacillus jamilae]|jgi:lichenan operon transcriptional antiterminator|uniref:BglG family transcription antiterminator n=1 Tax=Paenibacillus TaxID=44249 RepID=UPI00142E877B|nr:MULTISPECIES: BglG family transcription antiterminator [Paenibacillus]MDP9674370.1 lichenan operon transcriptional antiterminator [Paenibacillus jamilae]KAF6617347.1 BglG family transcription antiterminator [Paenibacillus sp. EKM101P]KAF6622150.1 BglG family transcription antiterminator [Paenibacillus sp. EKM102P]KAF6631298.1 BglG family transcription antiterminator [Paenibacillus sp. EKM10P]KAF6650173.1 BglG family transcription antiterminator [Paenibacillus sp. EKM11P]